MISVIDIWMSILIIYIYFKSQITQKYSIVLLWINLCFQADDGDGDGDGDGDSVDDGDGEF